MASTPGHLRSIADNQNLYFEKLIEEHIVKRSFCYIPSSSRSHASTDICRDQLYSGRDIRSRSAPQAI